MGFGQAIKTCFKKYAVFEGRAGRSEYWWFFLFSAACVVALSIIDSIVFDVQFENYGVLVIIYLIAVMLPTIAVSVRRLHDMDQTGWWYMLVFVPMIGWILVLCWLIFPGTVGPNKFGLDPKERKPSNPPDDESTRISNVPVVLRSKTSPTRD